MKLIKILTVLVIALSAVACSDSGSSGDGSDGDNVGVCSSDTDCPDGEQCYLLTRTCEVFCFDSTDCPGEKICTSEGICGDAAVCLTDDDCQAGETCLWDDAYNAKVCKQIPDGDGYDGDMVDGDEETVDGDDVIDEKCPVINVKPGLLDFQAVMLGESRIKTFTITNDSNNNIPLIIYEIHYDALGNTAEFTLDPESELEEMPFAIQRGQSVEVDVEYEPFDGGIDTGTVEITSNACGGGFVEVGLKSQYKGTSIINVDPKSRDFGNVNLGESPLEQEFTICNDGQVDGNKVLTITQIASANGVWDNFKCISPTCVTPQVPPLSILPGEQYCESFVIRYSPQSLADEWSPHRDTIMLFNDGDVIGDRRYTIEVSGSAESSTLFIHPYPVDFGLVSLGSSRDIRATLHNYADVDVDIGNVQLLPQDENDNCDVFSFGDDIEAVRGSTLPAKNTQPAEFTVTYTPTEVGEDSCAIFVESSLGGDPMAFPVVGKAKLPNEAPVCMASLQSHGQPIQMILEDIPADPDQIWKFYGNITYDPDTDDLESPISNYSWSVIDWPADSLETLHTFDNGMNVYTKFDVPGTYKFQLTAWDNENLECEEPFVIEVHVVGDQGLWLVMNFTPGDPVLTTYTIVDCDLGLRYQVTGEKCDDEHANSYGTCYAMQNAICNMPKISQGAAGSGTQEEINCSWLADGNWVIEAELEEDCESNSDWQTLVKCWGTHDPTVTIKMYDPNDYSYDPLFQPISTVLTYKGDMTTWLMRKVGGLWQAPVLINK